MKDKCNPWRYPFADINLYTMDYRYDILAPKNQWREWIPGLGFTNKYKWPNGTKLANFGDFEVRVSVITRTHSKLTPRSS